MSNSVATDVQILASFTLVGIESRCEAVMQKVVVEVPMADDVKGSYYPTLTSAYKPCLRKPIVVFIDCSCLHLLMTNAAFSHYILLTVVQVIVDVLQRHLLIDADDTVTLRVSPFDSIFVML